MEHLDIGSRVTALVLPLLESLTMELVDVEYVRTGRSAVLRIFIDRDGGITLDDCAEVSRELSLLLDVDDFMPVRYSLEVSSPGLDRPLKNPKDFSRFTGKLAKIRTSVIHADSAGNKRKTFLGHLEGCVEGSISLKLVEGQHAIIPLAIIASAHLEFEFL